MQFWHCFSLWYISRSFHSTWQQKIPFNGYKLATAANPNKIKKGWVSVYFEEFLVTRQVKLNNLNDKTVYIMLLCRSSSQTHDEFHHFFLNFKQVLSDIITINPFSVLITGDFNARTTTWWRNNSATTGVTKSIQLLFYGFIQIIWDPTHFLPNSSSYIDLTFTDKPNLVIESGPHHASELPSSNCFCQTQSRNWVPTVIWTFNLGL